MSIIILKQKILKYLTLKMLFRPIFFMIYEYMNTVYPLLTDNFNHINFLFEAKTKT